jgi:hypothetical protein
MRLCLEPVTHSTSTTEQLGVSIVMMRWDAVNNLELFEYRSHDQNPMHPSITDMGTPYPCGHCGRYRRSCCGVATKSISQGARRPYDDPGWPNRAGNRWIYFRSASGGFRAAAAAC